MQVAFLVGKFPVLSQPFIINQITGLLDQGHDVDIYALEGASDETQIHPTITEYRLLERTHYAVAPPANFLLRCLKAIKLIGKYFIRYPRSIASTINVYRYGIKVVSLRPLFASIPFLPCKNYDIVHCQFGVYGLLGSDLRAMGILTGKLISTFRGFDISEYIHRCGENVYDRLFQTGDLFLTNCDFFRQSLIKLGCNPAQIQVHYSSIDCQQFAFKHGFRYVERPIRIVTVGRLVEKKGIEYGIRGIAQLRQTYPKLELEYIIVGDGPLRASFEQLIKNLQLESMVTLVGWKQQPELIHILERSHILVAPSVTAQNGDRDAPVNTLKEAMAMGLPVIGTMHGGIPELIEDGISGFLVTERDANDIAHKLDYLINHSERWLEMGQAGRQSIETHFDMKILNQDLINIYQTLLSKAASTGQQSNQDEIDSKEISETNCLNR